MQWFTHGTYRYIYLKGTLPTAQIDRHERLAEFIRAWNITRVYTSLGMFGALSPKPTKLFSDDGWVEHLHRTSFGTTA